MRSVGFLFALIIGADIMKFLYPDFKEKALTFSYDDGTTQDRRLIKLFKKYGMKATFNLNSSRFGNVGRINHFGFDLDFSIVSADEVGSLYNGFEVATHGHTHPFFPKLDDDTFDFEITEDMKILSGLAGYEVDGHAYPCGDVDQRTVDRFKMHGIKYARTTISTLDFDAPEEFLLWHPTCHDLNAISDGLVDRFLSDTRELALLYIWGHSFELDKDDIDRWANIEAICQKLAGKDNIWYATNREICLYITAVRKAVAAGGKNISDIPLYAEENGKRFILEPEKTS